MGIAEHNDIVGALQADIKKLEREKAQLLGQITTLKAIGLSPTGLGHFNTPGNHSGSSDHSRQTQALQAELDGLKSEAIRLHTRYMRLQRTATQVGFDATPGKINDLRDLLLEICQEPPIYFE